MISRAAACIPVLLSLAMVLPGLLSARAQTAPSGNPPIEDSAAATDRRAIVKNIRVSDASGELTVTIDAGAPFEFRQSMEPNPARLVLELIDARNGLLMSGFEVGTAAVKKINIEPGSPEGSQGIRLVFELGPAYRNHEIVKDDSSFRIHFSAGDSGVPGFPPASWTEKQEAPEKEDAVSQDHWKVTEAYAASSVSPLASAPSLLIPNAIAAGSPAVPAAPGTEPNPAGSPPPGHSAAATARPAALLPLKPMTLLVGRGQLSQFPDRATRVSVTDPAIADAVVVSPHEVVLNGKSPGITTVMIWHGESVTPYEITVEPDLSLIQKQMLIAFPHEPISVLLSKDAILLTGAVSQAEIARQAASIAAMHAKTVVNLLQVPPAESRQVMLQVKFASVDRVSLSQLGVNLFSVNNKLIGTSTTQQFAFPRLGQLQFTPGEDGRPTLGNQSVSVTDLLNLFAFRPDLNLGAILRVLQSKNVLEILAEPNLITVSGREASFLAGGKFPFPVISSTGGGTQTAPVVTIQFRDFGVRLVFTPTVDPGGMIHLKVRPEVSSLDFANALTIQGFLIPAISTREVETEVDLREGETFAIAGLIDNRVTQVVSKIPGIGDLPILGHLFRSRDLKKSQSELLVLITPSFVKPYAPGEQPSLPAFPEKFLESGRPESKAGKPAFVGPRGHESPEKTP